MLSIVAVVAERHYAPERVIAAARIRGDEVVFEKEGYTWVEGLGPRFDAQGRLIEIVQSP